MSTCFRDMASCVSVFRTSLTATFDVLKERSEPSNMCIDMVTVAVLSRMGG